MKKNKTREIAGTADFEKVASGIKGLDDITGGGLPKGRPSLISGGTSINMPSKVENTAT
jgi:circadian clock protein KaiC